MNMPAIALEDEVFSSVADLTHVRCGGDILHPERESRTALEAIRAEIGSLLFSAQYQQRPTPPGGAMIKRTWVRRYTEPPRREDVLQIIQSWDTAMKGGPSNDWSVCTTWAQTARPTSGRAVPPRAWGTSRGAFISGSCIGPAWARLTAQARRNRGCNSRTQRQQIRSRRVSSPSPAAGSFEPLRDPVPFLAIGKQVCGPSQGPADGVRGPIDPAAPLTNAKAV